MATLFRWAFRGVLLLLLAITLLVLHSLYFKPLSIRIFYERVFAEFALDSPQIVSSLGMLPPSIDWLSDELDDYSIAKGDAQMAKLKNDLATLRSYDRARLDDALSYDTIEFFLHTQDCPGPRRTSRASAKSPASPPRCAKTWPDANSSASCRRPSSSRK